MESGRVYFLTFSSYGSHLHGDARGSYRYDSTPILPCPPLRFYMRNRLNDAIVVFSDQERAILHDAFLARAQRAQWTVDALNVRETHVHIVVFTPSDRSKIEIAQQLKIAGTLALRRAGFRANDAPVWTKSSAGALVWNVFFWRRAVEYTLEKQGENDYLRKSEFGAYWIKKIRETPSLEKRRMRDLYGGDERDAERAAFFVRLAESRPDLEWKADESVSRRI